MAAERALLDWLQGEVKCRYLSDLRAGMRRPHVFDRLCEQISLCPEEGYPLDEWQKAAEYLTGVACDAATVAEVKAFICNGAAPPPEG